MSNTQYRNFVGGQFVATNRSFEDINPATGKVYAEVHEAGADLVDEAADHARKALKGDWGKTTPEQRAALLDKIADGIERRFQDFLEAEVHDTGKPASLASTLDVPRGAANFRAFPR